MQEHCADLRVPSAVLVHVPFVSCSNQGKYICPLSHFFFEYSKKMYSILSLSIVILLCSSYENLVRIYD